MSDPRTVEKRPMIVDGKQVTLRLMRRQIAPKGKRTYTYASMITEAGEIISLGDPHPSAVPDPDALAADVRRTLLIQELTAQGYAPLDPRALAIVVARARQENPSDANVGIRVAEYVLTVAQQQVDVEAHFAAQTGRGLRLAREQLSALLRQTSAEGDTSDG